MLSKYHARLYLSQKLTIIVKIAKNRQWELFISTDHRPYIFLAALFIPPMLWRTCQRKVHFNSTWEIKCVKSTRHLHVYLALLPFFWNRFGAHQLDGFKLYNGHGKNMIICSLIVQSVRSINIFVIPSYISRISAIPQPIFNSYCNLRILFLSTNILTNFLSLISVWSSYKHLYIYTNPCFCIPGWVIVCLLIKIASNVLKEWGIVKWPV